MSNTDTVDDTVDAPVDHMYETWNRSYQLRNEIMRTLVERDFKDGIKHDDIGALIKKVDRLWKEERATGNYLKPGSHSDYNVQD